MGLFQVYVREKTAERDANPLWTSQISAADVEEAYRIGKAQFEAEQPELSSASVSIEAVAGYVEK